MNQRLVRLRRLACVMFIVGQVWVAAEPQSQDQRPVFRTGIDLRQLDVTVLDKKRQPVRGLTQADFTILEDGKPQKIEAFAFVDVPGAVTAEAPAWRRAVPSDITSNELDNSRVFILVIDDVAITNDPWPEREMKAGVNKFIDQLGPNDLAAVIFVGATRTNQNFTRDKAKILKAVDAYTATPVGAPAAGGGGACEPHLRLQRVLLHLTGQLATLRDQRRSIVYLGPKLGFYSVGPPGCPTHQMWIEVFEAAQRSHISVYPVDTMGLRPGSQAGADVYLTLAGETGGRAVVNSNNFDEGLTRVFTENSSFYLLGYQATHGDDGKYRQVSVKVNRPGLEVIATRQYLAERASAKTAAKPSPEVEDIAGLLPISQLPLRATAAPFAIPGADGASIAVAVGLRQPGFAARTRDQVDVLLRSFTSDGTDQGRDSQLIPITVPAIRAEGEVSRYDVLTRIELPKPGRYELRLSVHSEATDTRGSVYVDVDVPDFRKDIVSLSGVILNALPAPPAAPPRALAELTPLAPTTERMFGRSDIVSAFLRIYQGGADRPGAVTLRTRMVDGAGKTAFERADALDAAAFDEARSAGHQWNWRQRRRLTPRAAAKPMTKH